MGNIFISGRKLKTSYIRRLWNWDIQWWRKTHDSKANIFNHLIFIYFCKTNDKIKNWGSLSVMNSAVAVSLSIYLIVLFIFCIIILSFVTWPVIPARITMFINKSVEYRLLFSIYGHTGPYNHVYKKISWKQTCSVYTVIPARIIMFINKSVKYRLLFSIYGHTGPYNHVY